MEALAGLPVWAAALLATLFTYAMTASGAAFVFVSKKFGARTLGAMQGAAAGIMIAASFFSLLLPAMESLEGEGGSAAFVLTVGFFAGGEIGVHPCDNAATVFLSADALFGLLAERGVRVRRL